MSRLRLILLVLAGLVAGGFVWAQVTQDQVKAATEAYVQAQKDWQEAVRTYGGSSPQAKAAAEKMQEAARKRNEAISGLPPSGTKSAGDIIIDNTAAGEARSAALRHQICVTCGVFNVFNDYFAAFAKDAFVIIGNSVTVLVFGFFVGIGILRYALFRLMPTTSLATPPAIDLVQLLTFLGAVGALRVADTIVWRIYEAFMEWGAAVAIELIEKGSGGSMRIPSAAKTELAKIVGSAEDLLWGFVGFAFEMLRAPNFLDTLAQGPGSVIASVVFSLLVLLIYGGLLLYFSYFILQAFIFVLLPVPFGSLIVACAAFKETRHVTYEAIKLVLFAFGTFIGSGIAMGFTARVLDLSKAVIGCYMKSRSANSCTSEVGSLAGALGVAESALKDAFSSFEIFSVLIILGVSCWLVHYLTMHVVAKLLGTSPMGGPLAIAAAATMGAIGMGAKGAWKSGKGVWNAGKWAKGKISGGGGGGGGGGDGGEPSDPLRMP